MFTKKIKSSKILAAASAVLVATAVILGGCTPSGNLASEEKAEAVATEAPTATPTTAPTPTPIPTFTPTPMLSATPTPIPATTAVATPTPGAKNIYYATAGVNVRSEASTDSDVLGTLDPGDKITVLEMVNDTWAKIQYKEKTGYVSRKYIVAEADYDPSKYADDDDDDDSKSKDDESEVKPYGDMTEEEYEALQKARAAAMMDNRGDGETSSTDSESGDSTSESTAADTGSDDADNDGGSDDGDTNGGDTDDGEDEDTIDDTEDDGGSDEDEDTGEVFDEQG